MLPMALHLGILALRYSLFMTENVAYYFFEYDRPGKKTPGRTTWRMTIANARERHGDSYRPILSTAEFRSSSKA
jgi:hypothetical protein